MKKGILLFDIDRTIFDTDLMSKLIEVEINRILGGEKINEIRRVRQDYLASLKRDREFSPDEFCRRLSKRFENSNIKSLLEIFYGKKFRYIYKDCVYSEFFEVYKRMKIKFRFGIYSEGNLKFQIHKFRSMQIGKYLDSNLVFIVPAKDDIETLKKIPKRALIVDDKKIICEILSKNGFRSIWLNRKDKIKSKKFDTIHSLLELQDKLM